MGKIRIATGHSDEGVFVFGFAHYSRVFVSVQQRSFSSFGLTRGRWYTICIIKGVFFWELGGLINDGADIMRNFLFSRWHDWGGKDHMSV
jgi:hypothetical protein